MADHDPVRSIEDHCFHYYLTTCEEENESFSTRYYLFRSIYPGVSDNFGTAVHQV